MVFSQHTMRGHETVTAEGATTHPGTWCPQWKAGPDTTALSLGGQSLGWLRALVRVQVTLPKPVVSTEPSTRQPQATSPHALQWSSSEAAPEASIIQMGDLEFTPAFAPQGSAALG